MLNKSFIGLLATGVLFTACSTSQQSTSSNSGGATASHRAASNSSAGENGDLVWVEPPTGSHIGGGFVRMPRAGAGRNDEAGLESAISSINAASQRPREQALALTVAAQVSGASQQQLASQMGETRLSLGDSLAVNLLARNQNAKVQQIAARRAQGASWSDLARANGVRLADLAQRVRNADAMTARLFAQRPETGEQDLRNLQGSGVAPQGRAPGTSAPTH